MSASQIRIGTSWQAGGRTWEVYELLPFGQARVRTTDGARVGEMPLRSIRAAVAEQVQQ